MNNIMSTDDPLHRMPVLVGDCGASRSGIPGLAAATKRKFLLRAPWRQVNVTRQEAEPVGRDCERFAAYRCL